ncbi:acyltransferase family protein [Halioglobus japonicus]|nr:acyltransferase [Halioglobus japonicus]
MSGTDHGGLELSAGMRGKGTYLLELECIRGLAILLVYLFHVWGITFGRHQGGVSFGLGYVLGGNTGVTLFFVLSGFLLSLPWWRAAAEGAAAPSVRNYALARVLRIVPLYLVAVLIAAIVTGKWEVALQAALFQFVGFDMFPFSVVWWTLATEFQFYVLLPLCALALWRGGLARVLCFGALVVWLGWYLSTFVLPGPDGPIRSYWVTKSVFGRLPAFLMGVIAAGVYLRLCDRPQRITGILVTAGIVIAWLGLGGVLGEAARIGESKAEWAWHLHHSYEALLWTAIILLLLLGRPRFAAVLVNRPMALLGKLSYSLYLIHVPVLFYLIYSIKTPMEEAYIGSWYAYVLPVAALLLSVGLSYVTYRLIELPFLNLKHRIPF